MGHETNVLKNLKSESKATAEINACGNNHRDAHARTNEERHDEFIACMQGDNLCDGYDLSTSTQKIHKEHSATTSGTGVEQLLPD